MAADLTHINYIATAVDPIKLSIGHGLAGTGAGLAMLGASGVGAGQGVAAGRAAEAVGRNPEAEAKIRSTLILGMGIAESAAIYALIVSILLLFVF